MNSIDTLIALANLRGSLDLRCQFQGDWALDHAPENLGVAPYHIVLSGTCRAELSGGQQVTLEEGDILLMPGGAMHLLRSQGARTGPMQLVPGGVQQEIQGDLRRGAGPGAGTVAAVAYIQCGSGLARECGGSVTGILTDTPHSRASPLPRVDRVLSGYLAGNSFRVPRVLAVTSSSVKCACS